MLEELRRCEKRREEMRTHKMSLQYVSCGELRRVEQSCENLKS